VSKETCVEVKEIFRETDIRVKGAYAGLWAVGGLRVYASVSKETYIVVNETYIEVTFRPRWPASAP
jgi:hypothetical protein